MTAAKAAAAALLIALALAQAPASARSSTGVQITATVPVICGATVDGYTVVSVRPLLVTAQVHDNCNATHHLTVTYAPADLTRPNLLAIRLDGDGPDTRAPGTVTFANLPHTNSTKPLRIAYVGGTAAEHNALAQQNVFVVAVSAP